MTEDIYCKICQSCGISDCCSPTDDKPRLCAVCKSDKTVEFITITDCNLCSKCQDELTDGFEQAMTMNREDYHELQLAYVRVLGEEADLMYKLLIKPKL